MYKYVYAFGHVMEIIVTGWNPAEQLHFVSKSADRFNNIALNRRYDIKKLVTQFVRANKFNVFPLWSNLTARFVSYYRDFIRKTFLNCLHFCVLPEEFVLY